MIFLNVSLFFARVVLERERIIVRNSATDTRTHLFIRILRYWIKPCDDKLDVNLTVEQLWPPRREFLGVEWGRRKPPSIQERQVSFSIEPEQCEILMNYLHAQGAVADVLAEANWRRLQIFLASSRELRRLTKERNALSDEETEEVLRRTEAQILKVEEEL